MEERPEWMYKTDILKISNAFYCTKPLTYKIEYFNGNEIVLLHLLTPQVYEILKDIYTPDGEIFYNFNTLKYFKDEYDEYYDDFMSINKS